ncbi:MAG: hypothetical protein ACYC39_08390 [Thiobacillus sp.]
MFLSMLNRKACQVAIGVLLATCAQISAAAEWVSGQVTSINLETKSIGIDDRVFTLSPAVLYATTHPVKALQPGQAVRFEADGKLIKRIEVVKLPPT